jgi:hypothetical protein
MEAEHFTRRDQVCPKYVEHGKVGFRKHDGTLATAKPMPALTFFAAGV